MRSRPFGRSGFTCGPRLTLGDFDFPTFSRRISLSSLLIVLSFSEADLFLAIDLFERRVGPLRCLVYGPLRVAIASLSESLKP